MSKDARLQPARRRNEPRRATILSATQRIIAMRGPWGVNFRDVAAEAGVPLAATTYYFPTKDDLIRCALADAATTAVESMRSALPQILSARSPDALAAALAAYYAGELDTSRSCLMTLYELYAEAGRNPSLREPIDDWNRSSLDLAEAIVEAAGSTDVVADGRFLILVMDGIMLEQLATPSDRMVEAMRVPFARLLHAVASPRPG